LEFGVWLRRARRHREARSHLRAAKEIFAQLEATAWRDRAHAELRAAGEAGRPTAEAPLADLTPQERRIAEMAAQGMSNRQIADMLVLSARTVGYHLHKVFPKLDITTRAQLARALAALRPPAG
jgi:DNA-binding NarL/FixJ family response regulator